jgi:hypothetical protein
MAAASEVLESRLEQIVRRRREVDAEEAELITLIGEYTRSGDWQADGYLSAAAALANQCRMSRADAGAAVRLAKRLQRLPETSKAFARGEISRRHATVIANACTDTHAADIEAGEHVFADAAKTVDPDDLRDLVKVVTDALDGDGGAGNDGEQHELNHFHVSPLGERVRADGTLDRESGEIVATALDAMNANLHPNGDYRLPSVRHAEALTEICRRSLGHDHNKPSARRRGRPHLSAVVDIRTFEDTNPELVAAVRAEAEHFGTLSRSTLERIACDCDISRVITDGPSEIIDVGRKTRKIPEKLWNALVVRDRHCRVPGCDRPPAWCEAHHIRYWTNGGPTDLDNLELLCWHHHRQKHIHDAPARAG